MAHLLHEETAAFVRGQIDDISAVRFPRDAAAEITNGRVLVDGTVRRRPGTIKTHPTALVADGVGYGGFEYTTAAGVRQIIAIFNGTASKSEDDGATWTTIATGLRQDYYSFATMRVGSTIFLFAANGDTTVKRWNGTTWDTLPNAPSGVKFIAVFNQRLWFAGHSDPIVQGTRVADPTVIASPYGVTVQMITHSGDPITALYQIGQQMLVFDRQATAYIDGFGQQDIVTATGPTGWSRSVGCVAFRTVVSVGDNAVCWLSERGIEYYSPGEGIRLLSRPGLQRFFETIARDQIEENPGVPNGIYDDETQEYHCALSTLGANNNRIAVINLLQAGRGWRGAPSVDSYQQTPSGLTQILFDTAADAEGYLQTSVSGVGLRRDSDGYATLAAAGEGIIPTVEDADGYLASEIENAVVASFFIAHGDDGKRYVHSLGYDGFVRRHEGFGALDDRDSDETGGLDVELDLVSRPFLLRRPRQRKRVRRIYVSTINDAEAELTVSLRADGAVLNERTLTIPSTAFNQGKRRKVMAHAIGDSPQVEIKTTSDVRIALVGVDAEILREQ